MVLPVLLLLLAVALWAVGAATGQVRCVDAAREAARALARGESPAVARSAALRLAPPGSTVTFTSSADLVQVDVGGEVRPFAAPLRHLPALSVRARAAAAREPALDPLAPTRAGDLARTRPGEVPPMPGRQVPAAPGHRTGAGR